ncbi:MAG: MBL fold metallo-hydrolase [Streptosporangiaceae bacterium]|nr:MBL fold metallo-hydrolase [Streptosporangiaceae bacterium]MBV9856911.1 MBL fold metallo-hydrolase [Streptosporangiaceae bacterium]
MTGPITRHRDIDSLETAAAWPGADRATVVTLAARYVAAGLDAQAHRYFQHMSETSGDQPLPLALAGFFQARAGGDVKAALAKLDAAAAADLGLPQYLRGLALAALPPDRERAARAVADLEFVLAVRDQFPPLLIRPVYQGLASAYEVLGEDGRAAEFSERSGVPRGSAPLFGTDWFNAADGFRMTTPALARPEPGVVVARGYDFGDFAFIRTSEGVIAIDAGTAEHRVRAALTDAGFPPGTAVTHVILTHAHFDHAGGIGALLGPGTTVIVQAAFPAEQERQRGNHIPFRNFTGETGGGGQPVSPDQLVAEPTALTVGGTDLMLYPVTGGETPDALMIHLPASGLLFTGDVMMPYLGAPFFAEGSAEGLLETLRFIRDLRPRALIQGHPPLTSLFSVDAIEGLEAALTGLREHVLDGIGRGLTLSAILDAACLPDALRDHPLAVVPYLVTRDNFTARLYHQRTGYWQADGQGLAPVPATARAAALDLLAGGGEEPFVRAAGVLTGQGDHALALEIIEPGLLRYPSSAALARLRQDTLRRLAELHQQLDPFRFLIYSELAGLEIGPVR